MSGAAQRAAQRCEPGQRLPHAGDRRCSKGQRPATAESRPLAADRRRSDGACCAFVHPARRPPPLARSRTPARPRPPPADERVSSALKTQIIQARTAKKLTQAQLAQLVNEKPQIIQEYETGKAIPNPQVLSKMSRVLGVVLKKNPGK